MCIYIILLITYIIILFLFNHGRVDKSMVTWEGCLKDSFSQIAGREPVSSQPGGVDLHRSGVRFFTFSQNKRSNKMGFKFFRSSRSARHLVQRVRFSVRFPVLCFSVESRSILLL